jgi:hypothetical protein
VSAPFVVEMVVAAGLLFGIPDAGTVRADSGQHHSACAGGPMSASRAVFHSNGALGAPRTCAIGGGKAVFIGLSGD